MTQEVVTNSPNPGRLAPAGMLDSNVGGAISSTATTFKIALPLPDSLQTGGQFRVLIDSELVIIPTQTGTTLTGVTRGAEGSTPSAHTDGALLYPILTAGALTNLVGGAVAGEATRAEAAEQGLSTAITAAESAAISQAATAADAAYVHKDGTGMPESVENVTSAFEATTTGQTVVKQSDGSLAPGTTGSPNAVTAAATPTAASQIPVSAGAGSNATTWASSASAAGATPNPDTSGGSAGTAATFARGDHSHPKSSLYDGHGADDLNTVNASGAAVTIPAPTVNQASYIRLTAATVAITMPSPVAGQRFSIFLAQDGSGSRVPGFPAAIGWPGGNAPAWSTAAGLIDFVEFRCIDGANWLATTIELGIVVPPPPVSVIQGAHLATGTTLNLPSNVTAGNSILLIAAGSSGTNKVNPSGGGVTWTQIGWVGGSQAASVNNTQAWIGTNSSGGAGTSAITFGNSAGLAYAMELQGIIPAGAIDATASTAGTAGGAGPANPDPTVSVTAPRTGDFVGILVDGNSGGQNMSINGTRHTPWTVGTSSLAPWTVLTIGTGGNGAGGATGVFLIYQTATVNSTAYNLDIGFIGTSPWGALSFCLKG